ncbi:hypothetical protein ANCCAN_10079 [Ancylostoma caninum]|uniref:Uncharacterized protein n=1 Tax=Ancylostoma caninum TaxID=29170 RepID=A0A368GHW7_ANCCA|nr:hypothetical protein ANCCAN_10079 [Ancylostoma caninum]
MIVSLTTDERCAADVSNFFRWPALILHYTNGSQKIRIPLATQLQMLRLLLLLILPVFGSAGIYYGYDYIPPAYPPPYYSISSYPPHISGPSNSSNVDGRVRVEL